MRDERYTYGATCNWHGPIQEVKLTHSGLPCCPHCGGVLFEYPNKQVWDNSVQRFTAENNLPHYPAFVESWRLRCTNLHHFNWRKEYDKFVAAAKENPYGK